MTTILILTNTYDTSTDWVIKELRSRKADFVRINADSLPECAVSFSPSSFLYKSPLGKVCDLNSIDVIYVRRPDPRPIPDPHGAPADRAVEQFADNQWRALLRGLQISDAKWVNPLIRGNLAESKISQLHTACQVGFVLPDTLISNDPRAIRDFSARHEHIVVKALESPFIETPDKNFFIYSNLVDRQILLDADNDLEIMASPTIYQEGLLDKVDVRVTIVGRKVSCVEIRYEGEEIDWRCVPADKTSLNEVKLPEAVERSCFSLMSNFGLIYGAIDLARVGDIYYFLELNPSGEWGWLQFHGLPIATAVADVLESNA